MKLFRAVKSAIKKLEKGIDCSGFSIVNRFYARFYVILIMVHNSDVVQLQKDLDC